MSSYAGEIVSSLETKVGALLPTFKKSPYVYSPNKNNTKTNSKVYRVVAEDGNYLDGTMRTISKEQKFTVFLTTDFVEKDDGDKLLQDAIELLNASHELMQIEAMKNKFGIGRIMNVVGFSFPAPEIDPTDKTVTLGTTYTILYRMG